MNTVQKAFTIPSRPLTWLITGCSSGLGLTLARTILNSKDGHRVIASSRSPSRTPTLVSEITGKGGNWIELDLNSSQSISSALNKFKEEKIEIDILVNNAGYCVFSPVELAKEDDVRGMMETMFYGPLKLINGLLPTMRKNGYGVIVNVSSGASLDAVESMGPYAAVKAAMDGAMRTMSKEVSPFNIRALTIILGVYGTDFTSPTSASSDLKLDMSHFAGDSAAYKESNAFKFMNFVSQGKMVPPNDKDKAMKLLYELIVATEGTRGKGLENENLILLGKDMVQRTQGAREKFNHALDVYSDLALSLGAEN